MGLVDNAVRVMLDGQKNLVFDPESSILLFPECKSLLIDLGSGGQEILGEGDDNILGWPNYSPWDAFLDGLVNYINPPQAQFLRSSGVDLEGMFQAQLERVYLCRVVEVLG